MVDLHVRGAMPVLDECIVGNVFCHFVQTDLVCLKELHKFLNEFFFIQSPRVLKNRIFFRNQRQFRVKPQVVRPVPFKTNRPRA